MLAVFILRSCWGTRWILQNSSDNHPLKVDSFSVGSEETTVSHPSRVWRKELDFDIFMDYSTASKTTFRSLHWNYDTSHKRDNSPWNKKTPHICPLTSVSCFELSHFGDTGFMYSCPERKMHLLIPEIQICYLRWQQKLYNHPLLSRFEFKLIRSPYTSTSTQWHELNHSLFCGYIWDFWEFTLATAIKMC